MKDFDKNGPGWAAFGDYYAFTKKYWEPPEQFSEEYWDGFEADMKAFIKKHKNLDQRYIEGLTVPLIRRLERIEHGIGERASSYRDMDDTGRGTTVGIHGGGGYHFG